MLLRKIVLFVSVAETVRVPLSFVTNLNANQLKLIELNTIIVNYKQYIIKDAQIFFAFIFIGLIPYLVGWTRLLVQRRKKKN